MFFEHFPTRGSTPRNISTSYQNDPLIYKLCPSDQAEYMHLLNMFAFSNDRNKRNLGMPTFIKHLSMIHAFVCRGDAYDSLRGLVCGIEFGFSTFLINTGRLKKLMYRSKSCMNGCFQKLGYSVCRPAHDITTLFAQILPGFGGHMFTSRQWCVRKAGENSALCFIPNIKIEIAATAEKGSSIPSSPLLEGEENPESAQTQNNSLTQNQNKPKKIVSNFHITSQFNNNSFIQGTINNIPNINSCMNPYFINQTFVNPPSMAIINPINIPNNTINTRSNNNSYSETPPSMNDQAIVVDSINNNPIQNSEENYVVEENANKDCPNASFIFDIQSLLNHQTPSGDIHRMPLASLPPLRC
ncbi:hypothetical protein TRFO_23163 [Tritrichomonas foetus]|uniref:Initiator binding domain-containing protein n=1 Tax=Tritrichomonas foetus TaxID=1144522 RepID=A0A1J4KAC9_9EUKA|nr:hypothetical protein TRFO_23163 [Tritrichomonas foetus]|eukprot:OHT08393.1 hypothetical protein TRFO_23163 [Tritrichomonas foetus]